MKRLKAAFLFTLILIFVVITGNHFVKSFNQAALMQLKEIKFESNKEDYEYTIEKIKILRRFYLNKKPMLSLFIYQEQLADLDISLQCLESYAATHDQQNLINEAARAISLVEAIDESVSRLF